MPTISPPHCRQTYWVEQLASALCKLWFSTSVAPEYHSQCLGHIPDQWNQISPGGSQVSHAILKCRKFWEPSFKPLSVGYSVSSRKKNPNMFFLCSSFWLKILIFSQIKLISKNGEKIRTSLFSHQLWFTHLWNIHNTAVNFHKYLDDWLGQLCSSSCDAKNKNTPRIIKKHGFVRLCYAVPLTPLVFIDSGRATPGCTSVICRLFWATGNWTLRTQEKLI